MWTRQLDRASPSQDRTETNLMYEEEPGGKTLEASLTEPPYSLSLSTLPRLPFILISRTAPAAHPRTTSTDLLPPTPRSAAPRQPRQGELSRGSGAQPPTKSVAKAERRTSPQARSYYVPAPTAPVELAPWDDVVAGPPTPGVPAHAVRGLHRTGGGGGGGGTSDLWAGRSMVGCGGGSGPFVAVIVAGVRRVWLSAVVWEGGRPPSSASPPWS